MEDSVPAVVKSLDVPDGKKITKVEILMKQERFEKLKKAMNEIGVTGMTVTQVLGCGTQKGAPEYYRGVPVEMQLLPKIQVEMVISKVPTMDVINCGVLAVPTTMNYPAKGGAAKKVTGDAAVTFKNVSFTYAGAGAESLSDISFTAKRGQTIGIIGGTGSGKSTLVSLISRFYDATSGDVMVDGENVKNYTKEELCNKVGVVQQRAVLFKGSIRDNMKWGKEDATDAEIWEALTTAQAKEVVEGKQDQLDFMLEQNGKNLSGGQKQRLSIARALVKKPEILILDDSSSALDFATDAKLRKAVHNLEGNTTTFLVSQRIAGIRQADQILVLGNGTLEGNGTHDELMKTCEVYREIYFSQFPEERAAYNNESGVIA